MNFGFSTSVLVLRMVVWLTVLWTLMGVYLLGTDVWHFWILHHPKDLSALLDANVTRGLVAPLKSLAWQLLDDLKIVISGLVAKAVWRRLPVPDALVRQWALDPTLHPITGRMLVRALRWHGRIKVRRAIWIAQDADAERYFARKALQRPGSRALFERFPLADSHDDPV